MEWKTIEVEIRGTGEGLLMHSAHSMVQQTMKKNPTKMYDPVKEAEKVAYRDDKGYLCIPARCLKASILGAASWYKFGKRSAKSILAGSTRIEPRSPRLLDHKGKELKKYKIDSRPEVVVKARIIRHRPYIENWGLKFNIIYNTKLIGDTSIIFNILEESGFRTGLLDHRPQTYGENGTFEVVKFKPL